MVENSTNCHSRAGGNPAWSPMRPHRHCEEQDPSLRAESRGNCVQIKPPTRAMSFPRRRESSSCLIPAKIGIHFFDHSFQRHCEEHANGVSGRRSNLMSLRCVIPAQAGIQFMPHSSESWNPLPWPFLSTSLRGACERSERPTKQPDVTALCHSRAGGNPALSPRAKTRGEFAANHGSRLRSTRRCQGESIVKSRWCKITHADMKTFASSTASFSTIRRIVGLSGVEARNEVSL